MRGLKIFFMVPCVFLLSCVEQKSLTSGSQKSDTSNVEALEVSRMGWMSVSVFALSKTLKGDSLEKEDLIKAIVESIAADATYQQNGDLIDMTQGFGLLGSLRRKGLVGEDLIQDPLNLNKFFRSNPFSEAPCPGVHRDSIKDKSSYGKFCLWFERHIN